MLGKVTFAIIGLVAWPVSFSVFDIVTAPALFLGSLQNKLADKSSLIARNCLGFLAYLSQYAGMCLWCGGVFCFFLSKSEPGSCIPMIIWAHGFAVTPFLYAAARDQKESSAHTSFSALVGSTIMLIALLVFKMAFFTAFFLLGGILCLGLIVHLKMFPCRELSSAPIKPV